MYYVHFMKELMHKEQIYVAKYFLFYKFDNSSFAKQPP